jgi:hypothetical protein
VRTRSMGTVVRTMVACMGIPFLWSGQWRRRALARVWTRVVRESTSDEPAELPTEVKEVLAMFARASPNMATTSLTLVGNSADSRGLAQCRATVCCTPLNAQGEPREFCERRTPTGC